MSQKEVGYVELEWTCPKCGSKNPGLQKFCQACGGPQPKDVTFEQKEGAALIQDEKKLEEARKGPDIHCPFCGTRNPADAKVCSQCGGDLTTGERRESGKVVGAYQSSKPDAAPVICPNCATSNPAERDTCQACGALLRAPRQPAPAAAASAAAKAPNRLGLIIALVVGLLGIALCAVLASNLMRREDLTGSIQDVHWVRSIAVQELQAVTRQNWRDEIPAAGVVGQCEQRLYRTQADPAPGAEEVCGTPYTVDTGSGAGRVVQDCEYRIYEDYCSYKIDEWVNVNVLEESGADLNPLWPQLSLAQGQQEGQRQESYTLVFQTPSGVYEYQTNDPALFTLAQPGSEWTLTLNGFGQIVGVEPP